MARLIDFGSQYGVVSFPDEATDDDVVSSYKALQTRTPVASELGSGDYARQATGQFIRGLGRTIASIPEGLATLRKASTALLPEPVRKGVELASSLVGPEAPIELARKLTGGPGVNEQLEGAGKAIRTATEFVAPESRPELEESWLASKIPAGFGSAVGVMVPGGIATKLTKIPLWASSAGLGSLIGGQSFYEDAKSSGADEETAQISSLIGNAVGTSEALGLGKVLRHLNRASRGTFLRAVVESGKDTLEEALQEGAQQLAQNVTAKQLYDQDRELFQNVAEGAGVGGATGFLLSAVAQAIGIPVARSRMRREGEQRRRTVISEEVQQGRILPQEERPQYAQRIGAVTATPGEEAAVGQEAGRGVRLRDFTQTGLATETGTPITIPPTTEGGVPSERQKEEGKEVLTQDWITTALQGYGVQPSGRVVVVSEPSPESPAARTVFDQQTGNFLRIELNQAKIKNPNELGKYFEHEVSHVASDSGALNDILETLTQEEKDSIQAEMTRLGYPTGNRNEFDARGTDALVSAWTNRTWFGRLVGRIMEFANRIGVPLTRRAAESVAARAVGSSLKFLQTVRSAPGRVAVGNTIITSPGATRIEAAKTAYHGTPHEVERFRASQIGTGEGAQVYGWGLYFAGKKDVAEYYRPQQPPTIEYTVDGKRLSDTADRPEREAVKSVAELGYDEALKRANGIREHAGTSSLFWNITDANELIREVETLKERTVEKKEQPARVGGNIYTTVLKVEDDAMLDWDKPLSEQSEKVKGALGKVGFDRESSKGWGYKGSEFYTMFAVGRIQAGDNFPAWMRDQKLSSDKIASQKLAEVGIKGIRYLDQGSRAAENRSDYELLGVDEWYKRRGENVPKGFVNSDRVWFVRNQTGDELLSQPVSGFKNSEAAEKWFAERFPRTYNYVIFDENDIEITHRNGERVKPSQLTGERVEEARAEPPPMAGVQVQGAQAQLGRVAEESYKARESASQELEGLAYERKQFKMASKELKRLAEIAFGRFGATMQEGEVVVVPNPTDGVSIDEENFIDVDDTFVTTLDAVEVEHNPDNTKDMQAEVFFEQSAKRLNNILAQIETLQSAAQYYTALGVDTEEIENINKSIAKLTEQATKLGQAHRYDLTISQRASEIRAAEAAKKGRMAKRDALSLEPVSEFFGRQVGLYRQFLANVESAVALANALKDAATTPEEISRLAEEADQWAKLPEDVKASISAGTPLTNEQRASAMASLAKVFEDFNLSRARMAEMQKDRTPEIERKIRELVAKIADMKVRAGMAEVLITDALDAAEGETGGTGNLQSQAINQELKNRISAIQQFALNIGKSPDTNRALFNWLVNPASGKPYMAASAEAYGISQETLEMILSEVKRNPAFGSAIVALINHADKKLAKLPIVQIEQVQKLFAEGKSDEAKALASRIAERSRAMASVADASQREALREMEALDIERMSLNEGAAMFDEVAAMPEFRQIQDAVQQSPFGFVEPMLQQNNTTSTFLPFGNKEIPAHEGLQLRGDASTFSKSEWYRKVNEWYKKAQEHLDSYHAAMILHLAAPATNPHPTTLGFDLPKIRGLQDAVDRHVTPSFLDISLLSEDKRWKVPWLVRQLNKWSWFRQHEFVAKMVGGQIGLDLRGRLGDFINHFLIGRSIVQKYRDIPDKFHQAMKSHPSFNMNMAEYREFWNELSHWGRMFGSPVRIGFVLPRSKIAVTREDMALLDRQREFEEELRRRVTETTPVAGVRSQISGRTLVRAGAFTGDHALPRHLNRWADTFIADVLAVYESSPKGFDHTTDISASSADPAVAFWNRNTGLLIQHVLDVKRNDRVMRLGGLMQQAENDAATAWLATGTPPINSLEELIAELQKYFPSAPGINIRDHIINGLNSELRQYRDAASRTDQERKERAAARQSRVQIAFSADNEFTRPAAQLELPSKFYDYGALTPVEHLLITSRANHERVVAYSTALQRSIAELRNRLNRYNEPGSPLTEKEAAESYGGSVQEMEQVLGVLVKVANDFENAYATGNPALTQSKWYRDSFGLLTSAVLALPTVNLRNMTQGQFEVYMMSRAMGLAGHRLTMWRALKNMVRTLTRYGLHVGGGIMKRTDIGLSALTGKNIKIFEKMVDMISHVLMNPDYRTSAERVHELGYDTRDDFLDRMKRIWQETAEFSDREDLSSTRLPGTERKLSSVAGVPVRVLRSIFERIGVQESDLTINSSLLTYAKWLEKRLEEVAINYGAERARMGLVNFDATDPGWQLKPTEWAAFKSKQENIDSLGLFRLFLESSANAEGFQLEKNLWDYYQKKISGLRPAMFTSRQFDAVQRKLVAEFNASTPANRASAAAGNNVIRNLLTLQGYVSDGLMKMINTTFGGARDRDWIAATAGKLPIIGMLAFMSVLIGYMVGAVTGEWERRVRGRAPTLPTPLDKDFWNNWTRFGENTIRLSAAQLFYLGDAILAMRGEVQGNRGFDPVGRVFPISMVQRALNTVRGMWTTEGSVRDRMVPMADLGRSLLPWYSELQNAFGEAQGAIKQGERVLRGEAQQQGLLPEKRLTFQGPQYGPTTIIRRNIGEAVSQYYKAVQSGDSSSAQESLADAQSQLRKLREFYINKFTDAGDTQEEAVKKTEEAIWRDYNEINPVVAAMMGKRPTEGEWQLLRGKMSGARGQVVDEAINAWKSGAEALFGKTGHVTKEEVADARSGPSGSRSGYYELVPRTQSIRRLAGVGRSRGRMRRTSPTRRTRRTLGPRVSRRRLAGRSRLRYALA
jgi:hypothetical protein